jgi:hypothetical protein
MRLRLPPIQPLIRSPPLAADLLCRPRVLLSNLTGGPTRPDSLAPSGLELPDNVFRALPMISWRVTAPWPGSFSTKAIIFCRFACLTICKSVGLAVMWAGRQRFRTLMAIGQGDRPGDGSRDFPRFQPSPRTCAALLSKPLRFRLCEVRQVLRSLRDFGVVHFADDHWHSAQPTRAPREPGTHAH